MRRSRSALLAFALLAACAAAGEIPLARLAGPPAEVGRVLGTINKEQIAHDLEVDFLKKAAAKQLSPELMIQRAQPAIRIVEKVAPHWIEESRAIARAAGVSEDLYLAFLFTRDRDLFLHECTSYALARSATFGGAILFHKNRDNSERAQAAHLIDSSVTGVHKFISVGDVSRIGCSMMVNAEGLAGSADYPVHFTRKKDPAALRPSPGEPQYRGLMSSAILRHIAERASNCGDALAIIEDFVKKGYYAGGKVNGQHWLFVDRTGAILEVSNNSQHVVSKFHTQKVYFSRADDSPAAKGLRNTDGPIDFHQFHNASRDPSICLKSSISGMTVEIDPKHPQTLTCAWISLPARSVSFPLFMGQSSTPKCLITGEAYGLGKRLGDLRPRWEAVERSAHSGKVELRNTVLAAKEANRAELLDRWASQQAQTLLGTLAAPD